MRAGGIDRFSCPRRFAARYAVEGRENVKGIWTRGWLDTYFSFGILEREFSKCLRYEPIKMQHGCFATRTFREFPPRNFSRILMLKCEISWIWHFCSCYRTWREIWKGCKACAFAQTCDHASQRFALNKLAKVVAIGRQFGPQVWKDLLSWQWRFSFKISPSFWVDNLFNAYEIATRVFKARGLVTLCCILSSHQKLRQLDSHPRSWHGSFQLGLRN